MEASCGSMRSNHKRAASSLLHSSQNPDAESAGCASVGFEHAGEAFLLPAEVVQLALELLGLVALLLLLMSLLSLFEMTR